MTVLGYYSLSHFVCLSLCVYVSLPLYTVLFNSFKPQNGLVHFVKIYTSDFGKERLEKEEIEGPAELLEDNEGVLKGEGENPDIIEVIRRVSK